MIVNGWVCEHAPAKCEDWDWGKFISLHRKAGYRYGWEDRPRDMPPE